MNKRIPSLLPCNGAFYLKDKGLGKGHGLLNKIKMIHSWRIMQIIIPQKRQQKAATKAQQRSDNKTFNLRQEKLQQKCYFHSTESEKCCIPVTFCSSHQNKRNNLSFYLEENKKWPLKAGEETLQSGGIKSPETRREVMDVFWTNQRNRKSLEQEPILLLHRIKIII